MGSGGVYRHFCFCFFLGGGGGGFGDYMLPLYLSCVVAKIFITAEIFLN